MAWAPGELERLQEFLRLRQSRIDSRVALELDLMAQDDQPYLALQDNYAALVRDAFQRQMPPEDEDELFPDSPVVVNQNLW